MMVSKTHTKEQLNVTIDTRLIAFLNWRRHFEFDADGNRVSVAGLLDRIIRQYHRELVLNGQPVTDIGDDPDALNGNDPGDED